MRTTLLIIALLPVFVTTHGCIAYNTSEKGKERHFEKISSADVLVLAENGEAKVEIVTQKKYSQVVKFAAKELKKFLDQALKTDIRIVPERTGTAPAIFLGDNPWLRTWGINVDLFPRDAFVIKRFNDIIVIAGRDDPHADPEKTLGQGAFEQIYERGSLFGVYDFLERFAGVRFYFPGEIGTVVPGLKFLKIPMIDIYEAPDFTERRLTWYGMPWPGNWRNNRQRIPTQNIHQYRLRGQTRTIPDCHSLSRVGLVERFGESNPEYFALLENGKRDNDQSLPGNRGHLCFSQDGLEDEVYKDAKAYLTGQPPSIRNAQRKIAGKTKIIWDPNAFQPGYFNIMPNDNHELFQCRCPDCWPFYSSGRAHDLVWDFVSRIARRIQKDNIPGYITSGAYMSEAPVPACDIPDNVLVQVMPIGPWKDRAPKMQKEDDRLILDWSKKLKNRKVWLWNYATYLCHGAPDGVPYNTPRLIGPYYHRLAPYITGAFFESEMKHLLFGYLNWYVFSKIAWDNSTDVETLLTDHYQKMFGPAAKPMGTILDQMEELWTEKRLGPDAFKGDAVEGPVMIPLTEKKLWEEMYTVDVMKRFDTLFNQAETLAVDDVMALKRVKFFRKHLLGEILKERNKYYTQKNETGHLSFDIGPLPEGQTVEIDGKLNEESWEKAEQIYLVPLKADQEPLTNTTVRALWSKDYLYLAFVCDESRIDRLTMPERERDDKDIWKDSSIEIFLDPDCDRSDYSHFILNAAGSFSDIAWSRKDGKPENDWNWDHDIKTASYIGKNRWTAEIAIPVKPLHSKGIKVGTEWVANFCRSRSLRGAQAGENQLYSWSPFLSRGFHQIDRFGRIRFTDGQTRPVNLIKNGDFELGDIVHGKEFKWVVSLSDRQKDIVELDPVSRRQGRRSLKIKDVLALGETIGKLGVRCHVTQYLTNLEPGKEYLLTYFIKTEKVIGPQGGPQYGAFIAAEGPGFLRKSKILTETNPWARQGITFKVPKNYTPEKGKINVSVWLANANGIVWVDDVQLREKNR